MSCGRGDPAFQLGSDCHASKTSTRGWKCLDSEAVAINYGFADENIREKTFLAFPSVIWRPSSSVSQSMDLKIGTRSSKFLPVLGSMALTAPNISVAKSTRS